MGVHVGVGVGVGVGVLNHNLDKPLVKKKATPTETERVQSDGG